jgi:hypothetical protein
MSHMRFYKSRTARSLTADRFRLGDQVLKKCVRWFHHRLDSLEHQGSGTWDKPAALTFMAILKWMAASLVDGERSFVMLGYVSVLYQSHC